MLGFFSPDSRVQVTQTAKQVAVQRCGLTSEEENVPLECTDE
jgi:hypothetical protein